MDYSDLRPPSHGYRNYGHQPFYDNPPKPRVAEDILAQKEVFIERKTFKIALKENPRGRFMRIIENSQNGAKHSCIIIPEEGLREFQQMLGELLQAHEETPAKGCAVPSA